MSLYDFPDQPYTSTTLHNKNANNLLEAIRINFQVFTSETPHRNNIKEDLMNN